MCKHSDPYMYIRFTMWHTDAVNFVSKSHIACPLPRSASSSNQPCQPVPELSLMVCCADFSARRWCLFSALQLSRFNALAFSGTFPVWVVSTIPGIKAGSIARAGCEISLCLLTSGVSDGAVSCSSLFQVVAFLFRSFCVSFHGPSGQACPESLASGHLASHPVRLSLSRQKDTMLCATERANRATSIACRNGKIWRPSRPNPTFSYVQPFIYVQWAAFRLSGAPVHGVGLPRLKGGEEGRLATWTAIASGCLRWFSYEFLLLSPAEVEVGFSLRALPFAFLWKSKTLAYCQELLIGLLTAEADSSCWHDSLSAPASWICELIWIRSGGVNWCWSCVSWTASCLLAMKLCQLLHVALRTCSALLPKVLLEPLGARFVSVCCARVWQRRAVAPTHSQGTSQGAVLIWLCNMLKRCSSLKVCCLISCLGFLLMAPLFWCPHKLVCFARCDGVASSSCSDAGSSSARCALKHGAMCTSARFMDWLRQSTDPSITEQTSKHAANPSNIIKPSEQSEIETQSGASWRSNPVNSCERTLAKRGFDTPIFDTPFKFPLIRLRMIWTCWWARQIDHVDEVFKLPCVNS